MNSIGMDQIYDHSQKLLDEGIKFKWLEGLKIIGNPYNRGGVISFIYKDFHAHDVGTLLNTYNIAIRTDITVLNLLWKGTNFHICQSIYWHIQ